MTESPFAAPASASGVPWAELLGRLLVIEPAKFEPSISTTFGDREAIRATVTVIDQDQPEAYEDVLIFGLVMLGQLRSKVGQMVLGRLAQNPPKAGQNPAWRLEEATTQDQKLGGDWLRKRNTTAFAAPTSDVGAPPF